MLRTMKAKPPTNLEYALLGLLHQMPQSGYDLRKIFATTAMGNYSSSPGAIYPALKRLETRGLISGEIDDATELRPKKIFSPTAEGRAIFRQWLQEEFTVEDVSRRVDGLWLKFAFHSILDDLKASRDFLLALAEGFDATVESLEMQRKMFPEQAPIQPRLAMEAGIEQTRAAAQWAHKAVKTLDEQIDLEESTS
jgi:DNA-binding PadR family transcriptional regulator